MESSAIVQEQKNRLFSLNLCAPLHLCCKVIAHTDMLQLYESCGALDEKGIFLWLPYTNIFTTGPPVFVDAPFRLGKITNCSVETVSRHFSFL